MATEELSGMRSTLSLDIGEFAKGIADAQRGIATFAGEVQRQFGKLEESIRRVGIGMTVGITAPFAAMTVVTGRGAAGFEAAMNKVEASLLGIDPTTLEKLSEAAQELGPKVGRSAVEAAGGIETLALAGMGAQDILGGGLASSLRLAAANTADLGESGALLTDVMAQFHLTAAQLPMAVNRITGGLDKSKYAFNDFRLAMSQSASGAVEAGLTLDEFSTTVAAISKGFLSGSDAGTSLASMLRAMANPTKEAKYAMEQLGLSFYNADGSAKTMLERVENIQKAFANLAPGKRAQAFAMVAGDGSRALRELANVGPDAFKKLGDEIARFDAADKLAVQLRGSEAATNNMRAAIERLNIALGNAGILTIFTAVKNAAAGFATFIATLPPVLLKVGVGFWAVQAAIGPLILGVLAVAKVALPLLILRIAATSLAMRALQIGIVGMINPIGLLVAGLGNLIIRFTGAGTALAAFGAGVLRFAGVIGIAVTIIGALIYAVSSAAKETKRHGEVTAATAEAINKLNHIMEADVSAEVAKGAKSVAEARLAQARATFQAANAEAMLRQISARRRLDDLKDGREDVSNGRGGRTTRALSTRGGRAGSELSRERRLAQIQFDQATNERVQLIGAFQRSQAVIAAAGEGGEGLRDVNLEMPDKVDKATGPTAQDRQRNYEDELARANDAILQAKEQLTADIDKQAEYERALVNSAAEQRDRDLARAVEDKQMDPARAALVAALNAELKEHEHALVNQRLHEQEAQRALDDAQAINANQRDLLQAQSNLARTAEQRRAIELRILEIAQREERERLESIMRWSIDAKERERAQARLNALPEIEAAQQEGVRRDTMGPVESYFDRIPKTIGEMREQLDELRAGALQRVEDGFAGIAQEVLKVNGALGETLSAILRIVAQQAMLAFRPGGGGFGGFLSGLANVAGAAFGGPGAGAPIGVSSAPSLVPAGGFNWSLPAFAKGGAGVLGGNPGIDANTLSLNGLPIAKVGRHEGLRVEPRRRRGGDDTLVVRVDKTPYFDVEVQRASAPIAGDLISTSESRRAYRNRRKYPGAPRS